MANTVEETQDVGGLEAGVLQAYELHTQVGFMLRQAYQRHAIIFADRFEDALTTTQWAVVAKLADVGACSQNHLGRLAAMDVATIKGVVDRLVKRGYVRVAPDLSDRRRLTVALTEAGRDIYGRFAAAATAVSVETLSPLAPAERATFMALLKRLV